MTAYFLFFSTQSAYLLFLLLGQESLRHVSILKRAGNIAESGGKANSVDVNKS